jgi:hypothetical protein
MNSSVYHLKNFMMKGLVYGINMLTSAACWWEDENIGKETPHELRIRGALVPAFLFWWTSYTSIPMTARHFLTQRNAKVGEEINLFGLEEYKHATAHTKCKEHNIYLYLREK